MPSVYLARPRLRTMMSGQASVSCRFSKSKGPGYGTPAYKIIWTIDPASHSRLGGGSCRGNIRDMKGFVISRGF